MDEIVKLLEHFGPSRSSKIAYHLQEKFDMSAENARQRISRAGRRINKFPIGLLPNREAFLYLPSQRKSDSFWINFLGAMRETNSVYGMAVDSIIAKKGVVSEKDFQIICGAPIALPRQVTADKLARDLLNAGILYPGAAALEGYYLTKKDIYDPDFINYRSRRLVEDVILEGVKDWVRKLGMASYNKVMIRSADTEAPVVGPFKWDLTGPSYLLPLKGEAAAPGFLVADVFAGSLDEFSIRYMIRKAQMLNATLRKTRILPLLVAESFTGAALTQGHAAGVLMATPESLFGRTVARGLKNLLETLGNAAAIAAKNPNKLVELIEQLRDIEGAAGNLRGILFELIAAYLAKVQGGSIDIGINARDNTSGKTADIDVLRVPNKGECVAIECKGKMPGGTVSLEEVQNWISKIPTFQAHLRSDMRFTEAKLTFEIWTSGQFAPEALAALQEEFAKRKKVTIGWKDGAEVFSISKSAKEKTINNALKEHFLAHPLAKG